MDEKERTREDTREMRGERAVYYLYAVRAPAPLAHGRDELQIGQLTPVSCGGSIYLCREHGARESTQARGICETHTASLSRATTSQPETKARARRRNASRLAARDMNARCECEVTWQVSRAGSGVQASAGRTAHLCSVAIRVDAHRLEAAEQRFGWQHASLLDGCRVCNAASCRATLRSRSEAARTTSTRFSDVA